MVQERIFWQLFGKRLLSYKKLENGEVIGTGFLNPIIDRFRLIIMIIFQGTYWNKTGTIRIYRCGIPIFS